jgi:hypothetical protein
MILTSSQNIISFKFLTNHIKTLLKNHKRPPGCFSVLSGKYLPLIESAFAFDSVEHLRAVKSPSAPLSELQMSQKKYVLILLTNGLEETLEIIASV